MASPIDLVMPPACVGCGRSGAIVCAACLGALVPASDPRDGFVAPDPAVVLGGALELGIAAFRYAGPLRKGLAALKYIGASRAAAAYARAAQPAFGSLLAISGRATLVPVPLHRERQRERGYNQAELLARELARRSNMPLQPLLQRTRPTTKMHRLDRAGRLANLRAAFDVAEGASLPSRIIVVDDIITTSATLEACASVLRHAHAGVREVYGFALAREV
jgi:ComF family protein